MLPDHDSMVLNILAFYARATPAERAEGFAWYPNALAIAEDIAGRFNLTTEQGAALLASLSPQTAWTHNVRWAYKAAFSYALGMAVPNLGLGNNVIRATRALSGDLSDILRDKGTLKVRNFYGSIIGERGAVCVDRHAFRIALGDASISEVPGMTDKRYNMVADAYRDAARELRKRASAIQAVTWIVCRRERGLVA